MRIRYTEAADADLHRLLADTSERWPSLLQQTTKRLRNFERAVLRFPEVGERTRFAGIRRYSLTRLPYVAFYRVTVDEIVVLRLHHAAQRSFDPGAT